MKKKKSKKTAPASIDWGMKHLGNGQISLDPTCTQCGKPITRSTKYGMFCANGCGEKEAIEAGKKLEKLISAFLDVAGDDCWGKE